MSGGSYNYLCHCGAEDLFTGREDELQRMADLLARLGYAEDAARETTEVLLEVRQAKVRLEARLNRLKDVWQAVEWWESCDWSEDGVKKALEQYRGAGKKGAA